MTPANTVLYASGTTVFGWTIVERSGSDPHRMARWLARHSCGIERVVRGSDLRSAKSVACVCERRVAGARRSRATTWRHPLFYIWAGMVARCHRPARKDYARYGGRGIAVCDAWRGQGGFRRFVTDMGDRPSPKHSIDRIDSAGPYSPENCRWATMKEQQRNRSNNRRHDFNGESLTLPEVGERCGIPPRVLKWRLSYGWSLAESTSTPYCPHMRAQRA